MTLLHRFAALALAGAVAWAPAVGVADSWKSGRGKHGHQGRYEIGDCRYRFKANARGFKREVKCRRGVYFTGGPPPWAPAYGYRGRPRGNHPVQQPYVPPYDLSIGRCNRTVIGGLLGGAAGAAIGSQIGKGDGRTAAIIGGTVIGILIGGSIGRTMDEIDQTCVGQTLEHAPDGQAIVWNDPQSNAQYQVAPVQTIQTADGEYCREYTATATVGGQAQQTYGIACRQPDGSWRIRN